MQHIYTCSTTFERIHMYMCSAYIYIIGKPYIYSAEGMFVGKAFN